MGGICSRSSAVDNSPGGSFAKANGCAVNDSSTTPIDANSSKSNTSLSAPLPLTIRDKQIREPFVFPDGIPTYMGKDPYDDANNPQLSRELSYRSRSSSMLKPVSVLIGTAKVSEMSSLLGRAGTAGLGKAVEMLDTLGSSVTSLKDSGFSSTITTKGNKIFILSFEVANTIVKGANLMQSLSEKNVRHLKEAVFLSQGVQTLISNDKDELLRLAASDKRDELNVFSGEVVRFGNRCKDPQWHNLDRYFVKLGKEIIAQKRLKEEATTMIDELMTSVHYTSELYHELHALDRFEQDYNRKCQEVENPDTGQSETLAILRAELKSQKKHVRSLEKKSLWSKVLEEVMEKLVDIVHCLYLELNDAFKSTAMDGDKQANEPTNKGKKLGPAGLALHYANIINQIDTLVSRSSSIPPNVRDTLYQGLPPSIKSSLRPKLQSFKVKEELTVPQIKAEMEKTLQWLVPLAANTTKAHHGFGWVGEWANTGSEINRKHSVQNDISRIETLYHADKEKTDSIILDLIMWLHYLVNQSKSTTYIGIRSPIKSPNHSPNSKHLTSPFVTHTPLMLSPEDEAIFRKVNFRKLIPGISKSQEFVIEKNKISKHKRLIKSTSHSPTRALKNEFWLMRRASKLPVINFNVDKLKALDVIDRVDTIRS